MFSFLLYVALSILYTLLSTYVMIQFFCTIVNGKMYQSIYNEVFKFVLEKNILVCYHKMEYVTGGMNDRRNGE